MTQHKFYNEIVAWAMGCQIEEFACGVWEERDQPKWHLNYQYRIKPQPVEVVASGQPFNFKKKQYLYVYKGQGYQYNLSSEKYATGSAYMGAYIGKIEVQDD